MNNSPIPIKERYLIYNIALKIIHDPSILPKVGWYIHYGFCRLFSISAYMLQLDPSHIIAETHVQYKFSKYDNMQNYPEVIKYKPADNNTYWFPLTPEGMLERERILTEVINEMKINM